MIYYKLETNLKGKSLTKMQETIPPLIELITEIIEEASSIDDAIKSIECLSFKVSSWKIPRSKAYLIPENELWLWLSNTSSTHCKVIFNMKDAVRDFKIKNLLENL